MTLPALVQVLQFASGVLWLGPLYLNAKALGRLFAGRAGIMDVLRVPYFFAALVMVLGTARWFLFPEAIGLMPGNELTFWAGIYVLSAVTAGAVAWSLIYSERFR